MGREPLGTGVVLQLGQQSARVQTGPGTQNGYGYSFSNQTNTRSSVSYVTGSHAFKAGFFTLTGHQLNNHSVNSAISYSFLRGVPASITQYASPYRFENGIGNLGG